MTGNVFLILAISAAFALPVRGWSGWTPCKLAYELCNNGGSCIVRTSGASKCMKCVCPEEWFYGLQCEHECPERFTGPDCKECREGYVGEDCQCPDRFTGPGCKECMEGYVGEDCQCPERFTGPGCSECKEGYAGNECQYTGCQVNFGETACGTDNTMITNGMLRDNTTGICLCDYECLSWGDCCFDSEC